MRNQNLIDKNKTYFLDLLKPNCIFFGTLANDLHRVYCYHDQFHESFHIHCKYALMQVIVFTMVYFKFANTIQRCKLLKRDDQFVDFYLYCTILRVHTGCILRVQRCFHVPFWLISISYTYFSVILTYLSPYRVHTEGPKMFSCPILVNQYKLYLF